MLPQLEELLQYEHPMVVRSYVRTHGASEEKAGQLFQDMLLYLWIAHKHSLERRESPQEDRLNFSFVMHQEMRDIDNMWHNFILYTKDYTEFCHRYFDTYLHHEPDVAERTSGQSNQEFSTAMERYLSYVYDRLGEATVRRWFAEHL